MRLSARQRTRSLPVFPWCQAPHEVRSSHTPQLTLFPLLCVGAFRTLATVLLGLCTGSKWGRGSRSQVSASVASLSPLRGGAAMQPRRAEVMPHVVDTTRPPAGPPPEGGWPLSGSLQTTRCVLGCANTPRELWDLWVQDTHDPAF